MINRHTYIDRLHALRLFEGEVKAKLRKAESESPPYALSEQQRRDLLVTLKYIDAELKGYDALEPEFLVSLYARIEPFLGLSVRQLASMATKLSG